MKSKQFVLRCYKLYVYFLYVFIRNMYFTNKFYEFTNTMYFFPCKFVLQTF